MDFDPELIKKILASSGDNYFSKDRSFASPGLDPFAGAQGSNAKWAFPPSHQTGLDQLLASMPPSPKSDVIPPPPPMYPNTTEIPKTGYPDSGRTGDFTPPYPLSTVGPGAGHNLLDEYSKNLIALENAKRVLGDINPYNPIEQSVNKTYQPRPTTPISNEEQGGAAQLGDVQGVHNSLNAGLNAVMAASSIPSHIAYAEKPWSSIFNANKFSWDKEKVDYARSLKDLGLSNKEKYDAFKNRYPEYEGKQSSFIGQANRAEVLGGVSKATGAAEVPRAKLFNENMLNTIKKLSKESGSYNSKFDTFQTLHPNYEGSRHTFIKKIDELKEAETVNKPEIKGPKNWYDDTRGGSDSGTILSANRPGPGRGRTNFLPAQIAQIERMGDKLKDSPNFQKELATRFRSANPDYKGPDRSIVDNYYRIKSGHNVAPVQPTQVGSEVPTKALSTLSETVTPEWVKQWAKEANVPLKGIRKNVNSEGGVTHYLTLDRGPGAPPVEVRIAEDSHMGRRLAEKEVGSRFDTGTELPNKDAMSNIERYAPGIMNKSNMSYALTQALEPGLQRALGAARGGKNWLIPEELGPYQREFGSKHSPVAEYNPHKDPNQLKMLFSNQTDPTTRGILKLLQSKGYSEGKAQDLVKEIRPASQPMPNYRSVMGHIEAGKSNKNTVVDKIDQDKDFWKILPPGEKFEMLLARQNMEKRHGIPHSRVDDIDVMKEYLRDTNQVIYSNKTDPTTRGLIQLMKSKGGPQNLPGEMKGKPLKEFSEDVDTLKALESRWMEAPRFDPNFKLEKERFGTQYGPWANTNEKAVPAFSDIDRAKMTTKEKYDLAVFDQQISKKLIAMGHDPKDIPNIMKNMDTFDRMKLMHPELFNPFPGKPNG